MDKRLKNIFGKIKLPVNYEALNHQQRREVRDQYVFEQNGRCCFCDAPLDGKPHIKVRHIQIMTELFPEGFFNYPIHLHHNHDTGLTIGAVHAHCNAVLWQEHGE